MKKILILTIVSVALVSCGGHKSAIQHHIDKYATVTIPAPNLDGITENGREVLNLYRFASYEADNIYWKQYFGDKSLMDRIPEDDIREYAMINYGPWNRLDGAPFIEGYGERPAGVNFYPSDLSSDKFDAASLPDKDSPYTLIRRDEKGDLKTVWFHEEYSDEIEKIAAYLTAAAEITIKPSVRNYLLKKVEALRSDDYYESDIAWLEMEDSKMDLVIGPNETNDDQLKGIKKSFGAMVLLKDAVRTERLGKYATMIPELQKNLPCDDAYKAFAPGNYSDVFVCDALYYGGSYNAGIKEIAINLPRDERVQKERGTRTILLRNVIEAKFNLIVAPVAGLFLGDDAPDVTSNAFMLNLAFREIAHGLGVMETVNGKGSVENALGPHALPFEEMKANVVGTFLACNLLESQPDMRTLDSPKNSMATFVTSLLRSQRFGEGEALGRANIMILNYLTKNSALKRTGSGQYRIDYARTRECLGELAAFILKTQAEGDIEAADAFEKEYAVKPARLDEDMSLMGLDNIPIDVRFKFER